MQSLGKPLLESFKETVSKVIIIRIITNIRSENLLVEEEDS